jgi:16S rRNA (uracil1498-N3)-methyltransferase
MTPPVLEGPPGDLGPLVFVSDLAEPLLDADDRHHLERVLRVRPGEPCVVSDGRGAWRACRFTGAGAEPAGDTVVVRAPAPAVSVGFALVKGARPELVVQKLTELGVDAIRPFVAARSVVRWDDRKRRVQRERLTRVARAAAMQSRRVHLPDVGAVVGFAAMADLTGVARADRGGAPLSMATPAVLIGPEGGWAPEERAGPLPVVGLGPHVLRAETAAIAAGVVLAGLRGGWLAS